MSRLLNRSRDAAGPGLQQDWCRSQWSGSTASALFMTRVCTPWSANLAQGFSPSVASTTPRVGTTAVTTCGGVGTAVGAAVGAAPEPEGAVVAPGVGAVVAVGSSGCSALPQANTADRATATRTIINSLGHKLNSLSISLLGSEWESANNRLIRFWIGAILGSA